MVMIFFYLGVQGCGQEADAEKGHVENLLSTGVGTVAVAFCLSCQQYVDARGYWAQPSFLDSLSITPQSSFREVS